MTLLDYITNWDVLTNSKRVFISKEYDFWYCPECKRVIQCEIHIGGKALSIYKPADNEPTVDFNKLSEMEELIVFSSIEEDYATEQDSSVTLVSFLGSLSKLRYFMSADKKYVYACDCTSKQIAFVYQSETVATLEGNKEK